MCKDIFKFEVTIRFYEELNFFLPEDKQKKDFSFKFKDRRSIKDLIEACGVPHVEVDLILVNGEPVSFSYIVQNLDRISVYPVFESLDISNVSRLRPLPLRDPKFVLDVHLNKLARKLRLLGFDVDYEKQRDDKTLATISEKENRILLTRDLQLLMRKNITHGLYVRNIIPSKQVTEIIKRLQLQKLIKPFSRCANCNGIIESLPVESKTFQNLKNQIPEGVLDWCKEFSKCNKCNKVYWKGNHYDKIKIFITNLNKTTNNN